MEKYEVYFNKYAVDDVDEIISSSETASLRLKKLLNLTIEDGKIVAVLFAKIYEAILLELKKIQEHYSSWEINFCDNVKIGFTSGDGDEDDEKQGNFCPYITDCGYVTKKNDNLPSTDDSVERATAWLSTNIGEGDVQELNKIAVRAVKLLSEQVEINLTAKELIIPIFVITYQTFVERLKTARKDKDEFESVINFMGLFEIKCIENAEEGDDIISIVPSPFSKLGLKDDGRATASKE